jgi:hypothetical protein
MSPEELLTTSGQMGRISPPVASLRGTGAYNAALEHSDAARRSARLLMLIGGVVYTLWHFVNVLLMPDAVDPLQERLAFLGFVCVGLVLSFHSQLRRHLVRIGYAVIGLGTAHTFSLLARNDIATPYLIGVFVVLASVSALLVSTRAVVAYSIGVLALAGLVALLASGAPVGSRLELLLGVSTVQLALAAAVWRNLTLQAAARELDEARREVKRLQGLLPICLHCHRIRTDDNMWHEIQSYVETHADAAFTHSLCKECLERHYAA